MKKRIFYLTFPSRFSYDTHPYWKCAHPDGWIEISAIHELDARKKAFDALGDAWAFIYSEGAFDTKHFPKGRLATYEEMLKEIKKQKITHGT